MKDIKKIKLSNIATIQLGYPFRGKINESFYSDIKVIQMKDISLQGIDVESCNYVELTGKKAPSFLENDDILFTARGSYNYAVLFGESAKNSSIKAVATPHFFIINIKDKQEILPEFLVWQINSLPIQQYLQRNAMGSVAKSINRQTLENVPIKLPPLAIQQKMVKLIKTIQAEQDTLQKLIDNNNDMLNALAIQL